MILRNHFVLAVPRVAATARFFTDVLGFEPVPTDDDGWRFVKKDNCMIMLGECPDAIPPAELGDHSYFGYLVVDDVDAFFARVKSKDDAAILFPVKDRPWGMREFGVKTPDGHRLMFGETLP